jgi:hypothetical protein
VRRDQFGQAGKAEIVVESLRRRCRTPAFAALTPVDPGRMESASIGRHMVMEEALRDMQNVVRPMPGLSVVAGAA